MSEKTRWLDRRPLLMAALASAGFYGLFQAGFLLMWNRAFLGPEATLGITKVGLFLGALTVLALVPIVLVLRRRHPAWRGGDPLQASWSLFFGLIAGLATWSLADLWTSGPLFSGSVGTIVETVLAVAVGLVASGLHAPRPWLRRCALATVVLLLLCFVPVPDPGRKPKPSPEPSAPAAVPAKDGRRPDVVLVSIDTLRADHLGAYGRAPSITPAMDRIAREGAVFARGLAASPWTIPSVASLLTGLPVTRHGAGRPLGAGMTFQRSSLDDGFTTLAERFAAAGYRTRAVVTNSFAGAEFGMAQGFQEFKDPFGTAMGAAMMRDLPLTRLIVNLTPPATWGDYRASGATNQALTWLAEADDAPLFLWVHYIDPHTPYQADPDLLDPATLGEMMHQQLPEVREDGTVIGPVFAGTDLVRSGMLWLGPKDRQRLQDIYAGEVGYLDTHVGRLFDALRDRSGKRPVVAALTADHGEELWDHGHFEHGHDYYREVTWVPLVFWSPGAVPDGRTVTSVVGLVDVGPTLLDLAGLPAPVAAAPDEGRSLVPMWAGGTFTALPRFCGGNLYGLPAVLVEDGPWRSILRANGAQELYDVTHDPGERNNLAFQQPEVAGRHRRVLEPQLAALLHTATNGKHEMSAEELEALRALGYLR